MNTSGGGGGRGGGGDGEGGGGKGGGDGGGLGEGGGDTSSFAVKMYATSFGGSAVQLSYARESKPSLHPVRSG